MASHSTQPVPEREPDKAEQHPVSPLPEQKPSDFVIKVACTIPT